MLINILFIRSTANEADLLTIYSKSAADFQI